MHTVNGVAKSRPTGPHSHVQKVAATMTARELMPVEWLKTIGSMMFTKVSSTTASRPTVSSIGRQESNTASESSTGKAAAMGAPRNGTKRSMAMSRPHNAALGTPMAHRPTPRMRPTLRLTAAWESR